MKTSSTEHGRRRPSRRRILTPRTSPTWSASTRAPTRRRRARRSPRRVQPCRPGRAVRSRRAPTCSTRSATRSSRARTSSARCSRARRARPSPRPSARRRARAISSGSSPARWCARPGEVLPSVRPGIKVEITREPVGVVGIITPWNFPLAIPAWKIAPGARLRQLRGVQARRPGARLRLGADRDHRQGRRAGGRVQPGDGPRLGDRRASCPRIPSIDAVSFTGSVAVGKHGGAELRRAPRQGAARDGRQEPAGGARRRRARHRGEHFAAERVLLHRAALHGFEPLDRDRRAFTTDL